MGEPANKLKFLDFSFRLSKGNVAEDVFESVLSAKCIDNFGYTRLNVVDEESRVFNLVNGDFRVTNTEHLEEYYDVKFGYRMSKRSRKKFRDGGWYVFNAASVHKAFIVKNNSAFRLFVDKLEPVTLSSNEDGLEINHAQLKEINDKVKMFEDLELKAKYEIVFKDDFDVAMFENIKKKVQSNE